LSCSSLFHLLNKGLTVTKDPHQIPVNLALYDSTSAYIFECLY
jgi:hypothetical protein